MFSQFVHHSSRTSATRGQALVEFALVMVFFLVILLGVIDLGRVWFTVVAVEHAAAEGALFGLAHPSCITAADCPDPNNIDYRLKHESKGDIIDPSKLTYLVTCNPVDCPPGGVISVEVTYDFDLIAPGLSVFGGDSIAIRRMSQQIIATED